MCGIDDRTVKLENGLEILEKDHFDLNRLIVEANNRLEKLQIALDEETKVVKSLRELKVDDKSFKTYVIK